MLPAKVAFPVRQCCLRSRRLRVRAVFTFMLLVSATMTSALSTTLEDDFHIVHNLDNRSPEIDPFWYVGRGVRPIGRFGKRQTSSGLRPAVSHLELLLQSLRDKDVRSLDKILAGRDYESTGIGRWMGLPAEHTCSSDCCTCAAALATWSSRNASSFSVVLLLMARAHSSRSPSSPSRPYTVPAASLVSCSSSFLVLELDGSGEEAVGSDGTRPSPPASSISSSVAFSTFRTSVVMLHRDAADASASNVNPRVTMSDL
ncbi:hypothetical protein JZ751_004039 [Albula glossodonta]|uniref:Prolactin-releasing peptide n=1 Tax=Albula glossodonta TaxID=121402 RepID=A0A8T2P6Y0_9TELE|nr:hypothetical protein JZ751_004039 [Albula glossodonta]